MSGLKPAAAKAFRPSSASAGRPEATTEHPSLSSSSAMARPIPAVPPVTMATLPLKRDGTGVRVGVWVMGSWGEGGAGYGQMTALMSAPFAATIRMKALTPSSRGNAWTQGVGSTRPEPMRSSAACRSSILAA